MKVYGFSFISEQVNNNGLECAMLVFPFSLIRLRTNLGYWAYWFGI